MKSSRVNRLKLSRETIRNLSSNDLRNAAGMTPVTWACTPTQVICPTLVTCNAECLTDLFSRLGFPCDGQHHHNHK